MTHHARAMEDMRQDDMQARLHRQRWEKEMDELIQRAQVGSAIELGTKRLRT